MVVHDTVMKIIETMGNQPKRRFHKLLLRMVVVLFF
jgi:hypothetical protein